MSTSGTELREARDADGARQLASDWRRRRDSLAGPGRGHQRGKPVGGPEVWRDSGVSSALATGAQGLLAKRCGGGQDRTTQERPVVWPAPRYGAIATSFSCPVTHTRFPTPTCKGFCNTMVYNALGTLRPQEGFTPEAQNGGETQCAQ